jgi:hypothetical protein
MATSRPSRKTKRTGWWVFAALVLAALGVTAAIWLFHSKPAGRVIGSESRDLPPRPEAFRSLIGSWVRPDGGYVLDIRAVDAAGRLDAGYYNPRPINVAQAEAQMVGNALRVFIKLQDTGYPGATYTLTHNPQSDGLFGFYHQPAAGQTFEVVFVRRESLPSN